MDLFSGIAKMGASFLIVIGLIALTAYGARRFFGDRLGAWRSRALIQVLARVHLGARKEVALIEVGETCLVIGVTPTQISMLAQVDRQSLPSDRVDRQPSAEAS